MAHVSEKNRRFDFDKNIVFMGSPACARTCLEALVKYAPCRVAGVVTQRPQRAGRNWSLTETPCDSFARQIGIPCITPDDVNDPAVVRKIASWHPDLIVVVAYGQFLGHDLLTLPTCGCVNCHFSLLPKYRGASPVAASILNGDSTVGVTLIQMSAGMDDGPILVRRIEPMTLTDTAGEVTDRLAIVGAASLVCLIRRLAAGEPLVATAQDPSEASVVFKLVKGDGLIDWREPAERIERRVRAFDPWPGTWTVLQPDLCRPGTGGRVGIEKAEVESGEGLMPGTPGTVIGISGNGMLVMTGEGSLRVLRVRPEGGRSMSGKEFLQGRHGLIGRHFVNRQ